MSFRFRFASILHLRGRERDMAAAAVEEVDRAIALVDRQMDESRVELEALAQQRKVASTGYVAIGSLMEFQRHQLVLIGNLQYLGQQRSTLVQEKTRRDSKLMQTQQAVKSFENLCERQQAEAHRHEAARLQSRLDEWSNTRTFMDNL